jgi:hypothetical protein
MKSHLEGGQTLPFHMLHQSRPYTAHNTVYIVRYLSAQCLKLIGLNVGDI